MIESEREYSVSDRRNGGMAELTKQRVSRWAQGIIIEKHRLIQYHSAYYILHLFSFVTAEEEDMTDSFCLKYHNLL